jgi:hypothetical protein
MAANPVKSTVTVYISAHASTIYTPEQTRSKTSVFENVEVLSSPGEKLIPAEMGVLIYSKTKELNGLTTEIATFTELNRIYKDGTGTENHTNASFHRKKLREIKREMKRIDKLADITYTDDSGYSIGKPVNNKSFTFHGKPNEYRRTKDSSIRSGIPRIRGDRKHNIVWCHYGLFIVASSIEDHQDKSIASIDPLIACFESSAFPKCMLDPTSNHFEKSNLLNLVNYNSYWKEYIESLPIQQVEKDKLKNIIKNGISDPYRLDLTDIIELLKGLSYDIINIVDPTCNTLRERKYPPAIMDIDTQDLDPNPIDNKRKGRRIRSRSATPSPTTTATAAMALPLVVKGGGRKTHKHKYKRNRRRRRRYTRRRMRQ